MKKVNVYELEGMKFESRITHVVIGPNGKYEAENFVQGYSEIDENGTVPMHDHPQEECYTIIAGNGTIKVGSETSTVRAGDYILIPPNVPHSLKNNGLGKMIMMFVYAPKAIVDHWDKELKGELK